MYEGSFTEDSKLLIPLRICGPHMSVRLSPVGQVHSQSQGSDWPTRSHISPNNSIIKLNMVSD